MSERIDRFASIRRGAFSNWLAQHGLFRRWIGTALLGMAAALLMPMQAAFAQKLTPAWVISSVAGDGSATASPDGGAATSSGFGGKPFGVARDKAGNLYVCDQDNAVRKIDTNGIMTTVAGTGTAGYSGDGGPATSAELNSPYGVAIDNNGNLLIADEANSRIRKVNLQTGIITTVAGDGTKGYAGDGGAATSAELSDPFTVTSDIAGNIYIADYGNHRIRKVDTNGNISTFAGTGTAGYTGDGGVATSAELDTPWAVYADPTGDVYIADNGKNVLRMVDPSGTIHTIAGTGTACNYTKTPACDDGGPATSALLDGPHGVATDGEGNVYFPDESTHVLRWVNSAGIINKIAGTYGKGGWAGDGGLASASKLDYPYAVTIDPSNNLYIADAVTYRIRFLSLNTGLPATAVGSSSAAQNLYVESSAAVTPQTAALSPSASTEFALGALSGCSLGTELAANTPCTVPITFQPASPGLQTEQLAFTDASGNISAIGLSGVGIAPQADFSLAAINTIAGNGTAGNTGAGGLASTAEVSAPRGGVIDSAGNIYFADSGNNVIRRIDAVTGNITTVAGTGAAGYSGDGAAATAAQLNAPAKVALDAAGNLYIADTGNNVIRFVDAATGFISTIAGTGTAGDSGDGGAATAAELNQPQGLAVDLGGHVYVADTGNNVIRYFGRGGNITTLIGAGTAGYSGDGGNAYSAELNAPEAVALGQSGRLYIADTGNDVVRMVSATNQISTFAGVQGSAANAGDGGAATTATLDQPSDIALDAAGDVYIAAGGQVRVVNAAGTISTLAGTGAAGTYSGDGGVATSAVIPAPASSLMLDNAGDIVIAATAANRLLKVSASLPAALDMGIVPPGQTGSPTSFSVLNTGNSTLNISGISSSSTDFVIDSSEATSCSSSTALAPGQSCTISVILSPASTDDGAVSGTLTLTDNTLNGAAVTQTIALSGATKVVYATTTTISTNPASPVYGSSATITAKVSSSGTLTGTVNFTVNGNSIGSAPVSNNQATIALPSLPAGVAQVTAVYSGDSNDNSSTGAGSITIQPAVLTVTANNATMGEGTSAPSFTYTITGFVNGDTSSVVTGAPSETTTAGPSSPEGAYPIVISQGTLAAANYTFVFVNGTITVGPPPAPDFLLSTTPTTASLPYSQPYVATVTLIPLYNYTGTVKLSCTSSPAGLGCTPAGTLTGGGGPLTGNAQGSPVYTQITITGRGKSSSSGSAANQTPSKPQQMWLAIGIPLGLFGLVFCRGPKGKWPGRLLGLILLAMVVQGTTSCSSSTASTAATGTYQVTVTATDTSSNLSHSATMTLTYR